MKEEQGIIKKIKGKVDNYFFNRTYEKFMSVNPKFTKSDIPQLKKMLQEETEETLAFEYMIEAAKQINDRDFLIYCIESHNISEFDKCELIKSLGDDEYTKQCINNPNLWSDKKITVFSPQIYLIKSLSTEQIKQFIEEPEELIPSSVKVYFINEIGDVEYTKQCIENSTDFGIDQEGKGKLIIQTKDDDFIRQQFMPKSINAKIDIPAGMTIGAEIETEHSNSISTYGCKIMDWDYRSDHSLGNTGSELVSPIMVGSSKDSEDIHIICNMLQQAGGEATEKCGGHIHIGADYLTTSQSFLNLISIWCNTEKVMYQICNKPGDALRGIWYSAPVSGMLEKAIEDGQINMNAPVYSFQKIQTEIRQRKIFWIKHA